MTLVSGERAEPSAASAGLTLDRMLAPLSVAVVGATDRPGSYGAEALLNLGKVGFSGPVWGVNPRRSEVLGYPCVPSVAELPEAVDAVVVAVPADGVPEVIEQAGARGCGSAVVFSAGFGEVRTGDALQAAVVDAAARHRLPVCGPNCNGIVAPGRQVALWGDTLEVAAPGAVALVSQSGNVAVNALATRRGLRFHTVIASGNQAVVDAADYLAWLAATGDVGAIALYLEDDGGPRLCDGLAACADVSVPVVVLKVGSTSAGAAAASAHSGALAGDQRVFRSLIEEAGAVWAADVHELLELSKTLAVPAGARSPTAPERTPGIAIMTCSGGDSAQGADEAQRLRPVAPGADTGDAGTAGGAAAVGGDRRQPARLHVRDLGRGGDPGRARRGARSGSRRSSRGRLLRPAARDGRRPGRGLGGGPRGGDARRRAQPGTDAGVLDPAGAAR